MSKKIILLIILVATAAFGLGYSISNEHKRAPIIIEKYSANEFLIS